MGGEINSIGAGQKIRVPEIVPTTKLRAKEGKDLPVSSLAQGRDIFIPNKNPKIIISYQNSSNKKDLI